MSAFSDIGYRPAVTAPLAANEHACPVPGCLTVIGDRAVLCTRHYFSIEPARARLLVRKKIEAGRECDPARRRLLESELARLTEAAIRTIKEGQSAA